MKQDKTSVIFGNVQSKKVIKKAEKGKAKYIKKFSDDSVNDYKIAFEDIPTLSFANTLNMVFSDKGREFPENSLIVGNIRMGFGHYRISIAVASCAAALGYRPLWLDLASFDATGSKMIRHQNDLYSLASRISQKSRLFNSLIWEPLNSEGFKKISYNACDQKNSELLVPIFKNIPKNIPLVATHVWPSQGAVHAGFEKVVNAIPDNWPMALHLSEGALHTVQTPFAYLGYKKLNGFDKKVLSFMDESDIKMVGHYIDHELVSNVEYDNERRIKRIDEGKPYRILLTVGGAGAGQKVFLALIRHLMPKIKDKKVALFINFGDHLTVYDYLCRNIKGFDGECKKYFNRYEELKALCSELENGDAYGIYAVCNDDIFEAVYSTNLLMRHVELLITKPSELSYYPIPKLFNKHIGGHEVYGARYSAEIGDGTFECPTKDSLCDMIDYLLKDKQMTKHMCRRICTLKDQGYYNGAYECVKLAVERQASAASDKQ